MLIDFEEAIVYNPMVGAVALWEFTRKYETHRHSTEGVNLLAIMPVLPILMQRAAAEKLSGMRFESGLAKFLIEHPIVKVELQERLAAFSALSLSSLNIACAAGLLERMPAIARPLFITRAKNLPGEIRLQGAPAVIALAARRLGAFFRDETLFQIEAKLGVIL